MNKLIQLINLIENIFKEQSVISYFLKQSLTNLKNHLEDLLSEKFINYNNNPKNKIIYFFKDEFKNLDVPK